MQGEKEEIEFAHPYFLRGQEHLLDQIKRKVSMAARPAHFMPNIKSDKVTDDNAVKLFTHSKYCRRFFSLADPKGSKEKSFGSPVLFFYFFLSD
jgi:hypothetical protein